MIDLLPVNEFSRPGTPLDSVYGVVWHWVGNAGKGNDHTARYFEILGRQEPGGDAHYASAHFIIDERDFLQVIPGDEVAYHAGSRWWNYNTIGIEICHPTWDGKIPRATRERLINLTADIMNKAGMIGINRICRHYDITGKVCPKWYVDHPGDYEVDRIETERRRRERYKRDVSLGDFAGFPE